MIHTPFEGKWQNEPNMHCRSKAAADIEPAVRLPSLRQTWRHPQGQ
jgi:hypothetical protein